MGGGGHLLSFVLISMYMKVRKRIHFIFGEFKFIKSICFNQYTYLYDLICFF